MKKQSKKDFELYLNSLDHMIDRISIIDEGYVDYQFKIFESLVYHLIKDEGLVFNTLFAKISYLGLKYSLKKRFLFDLHFYRKEYDNSFVNIELNVFYQLGLYLIGELVQLIDKNIIPKKKLATIHRPEFEFKKNKLKGRKLYGRFALIGKKNSEEYIVIEEDNPTVELIMRTDNLEVFRNSISFLNDNINKNNLPLTIGLVYIDIESTGVLLPQVLVIQPDYLVDVTAVAECFKTYGGDARYYLINKFQKSPKNKYITVGNIVNYFLDELMNNPEIEFNEIIHSIFHLDPIIFVLLEDKEVKEIVQNLKKHFDNLKRVVNEDFKSIYIDRAKCYIEPSFYSPIFGIQGRLDIFYKKDDSNEAAIIELKSGKLFRPNSYGLNTNHYTQTLLYEIMIRSVFDFKVKPINYILYSVLEESNLRFAPTISAQQKEAISIRNDIIATEEKIIHSKNDFSFYDKINIDNFPGASGFLKRDIEKLQLSFKNMYETEKAYFTHFASFISREHQLAKTGFSKGEKSQGQSSLWLQNDKEKEEHFAILKNVEVVENKSQEDTPQLMLRPTSFTNELANFRKGDIVLIYPTESQNNNKIESQIFKGSLVELINGEIIIRLRSKVYNQKLFNDNLYWNIEHDFLDSGFSKMFKSLFGFFGVDKIKRDLILSIKEPAKNKKIDIPKFDLSLTEIQKQMVQNIISAEDYYLLWGPPGTGKTSKVIKEVVRQLNMKQENIMLLAYTNRAVDELCESVEDISEIQNDKYIRIGSRFSSDPKYSENLFDNKLKTISTRVELKELIGNTSVFVATVSSLQSKSELFFVKDFDTLIVDEASQLLEPMLVSILPYFKRFILVGDHMQLPAVVTQSGQFSIVENEKLLKIGLEDMRTSLFERLFNQAVKNKWDWAYGMLSEQGRMHRDIMKFPDQVFYQGKLDIISNIDRLTKKRNLLFQNKFQQNLISSRNLFIPTEVDDSLAFSKVNIYEAKKIVELIKNLIEIYEHNNIELTSQSIGVITTFRAQIAQIRNELEDEKIDFSLISIDTVERYQGSARDIILYSTSVNSEARLNQIISRDKQGLDRKLNVVITRAKEQFILLGNPKILSSNETYKKLIEVCYTLNL